METQGEVSNNRRRYMGLKVKREGVEMGDIFYE